jgi:hypothetical protein
VKGFLAMAAACGLLSSATLSLADMTGLVPGDVVISNITEAGPGHAGIYIGRWCLLPKDLQARYANVLEAAAVRSGSVEILDSYLVVDSMPGRGVRVSPMIEQFTDYHGGTNAYYPNLKKFDLLGALRFENDKGLALRWESLPDKDARRYKIVEMALQCAEARVPYDDEHGQLATTMVGESLRSLAGGSGLKLDCIAFCHFAYWKGARIDLDVSMMPFHAPSQLYDYAKKNQMWRPFSFLPLLRDAAYLGTWKPTDISIKTSGMTKDEAEAARNELGSLPAGTRFQVRRLSSDFTFEVTELLRGEPQGEVMRLKLDKEAVSPIRAGCASSTTDMGGGTMTVTFMPFSDSLARVTTVVRSGGKQITATMMLERERIVRKVPK